MANIKSQKKRILISREENAKNTSLRTKCKNAVKKYEAAIAEGNVALAEELLPVTVSTITKAGIYKDNTVSRKVWVWRSLVARLNGVQEAGSSNLLTQTKTVSVWERFFIMLYPIEGLFQIGTFSR